MADIDEHREQLQSERMLACGEWAARLIGNMPDVPGNIVDVHFTIAWFYDDGGVVVGNVTGKPKS